MDPKRWERIQALFHEALRYDGPARARFLREECGPDDTLRREVEELLASDTAEQEDTFHGAVRRAAGGVMRDRLAAPPGSRIGPYRIVRELGSGGMGRVYLAVRDDEAFVKKVAIKRMRGSVRHRELAERFRNERQILARLEHPNIARILDGGATDDGEPYVVMEYVEGDALDRHCELHHLDVAQRLALFVRIGQVVEYAHSNLIIHRDLKPANILVTATGEPKLLDFGIATLLDEPAPGGDSSATQRAVRLMTPVYASPEQVRGDPVHTATDVYSLGVVLYELLTGVLPFRVPSGRRGDMERAVLEQDPEPPSHVDGRLSGDLDAIVMKALRKDRNRRYASVARLVGDVQNFLAGRPVSARKPTAGYRLRRFIARHRLRLALAAVSAAAFLALGLMHTNRLQAERDLARLERAKAEEVTRLLIDLFESPDPGARRGEEISVREVLDTAAARIPRELADQPGVRSELMHAIGVVYFHLGMFPESRPLLEEAVRLKRAHPGRSGLSLATMLLDLGRIDFQERDRATALRRVLEALEIRESELGPEHLQTAEALDSLGAIYLRTDRDERARQVLERAYRIKRKRLPPDDAALARTLDNLAVVALRSGDEDLAYRRWRRALGIVQASRGEDHPDAIRLMGQITYMLRTHGRYDEALAQSAIEIALNERVMGPHHFQTDVARAGRFHVLFALGRFGEGQKLLEKVRADFVRAFGAGHSYVTLIDGYLGRNARVAGRYDEAREWYDRKRASLEASAGPQPSPRILDVMVELAAVELARGNRSGFHARIDRAAAYRETLQETEEPGKKYLALLALSRSYRGAPEARSLAERAVADIDDWGRFEPLDAETGLRAATALVLSGAPERGLEVADRCMEILGNTTGPSHPLATGNLAMLRDALVRTGHRDLAERYRSAPL